MKTKATMIVILLFSFSAFGKTEKLSDLGKLRNRLTRASFMKKVINADSIASVYDAPPANDYEEFRAKLAPDAGAVVTRLYKGKPSINQKNNKVKKNRSRRIDFNIFGSKKKEL